MSDITWSPSKLNMYLRCPAQYYYRYVLGLKEAPKSALVLGSSVDAGLNANLEQKIQSDVDIALKDVLGAYEQAFDSKVKESPFEDKPKGEIKDLGVGLVKVYHEKIAPTVHPMDVQKHLKFDLYGVTIQGYEDVFTKDLIQIDNKTSGKTPGMDAKGKYIVTSDYATQMTTYRLGRKAMGLPMPKACRFDYMVKTKEPKTVQVDFAPEQGFTAVENFVGKQYQKADALVKTEIFIPQRGNFMCSETQCGFWKRCQSEM